MAYNLNQQKASGHGIVAKIKRFFFGAHQDKLTALNKQKIEDQKRISQLEALRKSFISWNTMHSSKRFQRRRRLAAIAHKSRMLNYSKAA